MYLANNNLYFYAMPKSPPKVGFKWLDPAKFKLDKCYDGSCRVSVLEVDLACPKELHELHDDYLLLPDKLEIKREMLSDDQLETADDYKISIANVKKLVPNFLDKKKYVLHC